MSRRLFNGSLGKVPYLTVSNNSSQHSFTFTQEHTIFIVRTLEDYCNNRFRALDNSLLKPVSIFPKEEIRVSYKEERDYKTNFWIQSIFHWLDCTISIAPSKNIEINNWPGTILIYNRNCEKREEVIKKLDELLS